MQLGIVTPKTSTINGLLSARSLASMQASDALDQAKRTAQEAAASPLVTSLVAQIRADWTQAKQAKQSIETAMLSAVRSRRGEYDPDIKAELDAQGGSKIYMLVFATKARQLKALLTDIMVASGAEKPWTLSPTPVPTLPPNIVSGILQETYKQVLELEQMGAGPTTEQISEHLLDVKTQVSARMMELATEEAERAEKAVEDVLAEGGFLEALDQFIDDLTVFKTAFLKGPVVHKERQLVWGTSPGGGNVAQVSEVSKRVFKRVDPFMIYPSPLATSVHDGYLIERHKLNRAALSGMIGIDGYSEDAIRAVLDEHGKGGLREWLSVDTERATAEGRDNGPLTSSSDIDALQYWGSVSGKMLREWGMSAEEVPDEAKEYDVEAWLIGNWVIKAALNADPLGRRPYFADGFSKIPGAFWHNSLYDTVSDCQRMCNAAARALSNNLGISSGPQVNVNIDRLPSGEDVTNMYPWKVWQTTNDPMGSNSAAVSFFQPTSNASELMAVFSHFSNMADEYAGIPKYMAGMAGGEGGAGRTASGLSMMIGNASKQIKSTISSIDLNVIGPAVERTYQHIMLFSPEMGLSGDLQVRARGATSLVAKEVAQLRLNEFLRNTANPIDLQIIGQDGRAELLRGAVKRLDLPNPDKVVPSATILKQRAAVATFQAQQQAALAAPEQGSGQQLMDGTPTTDAFNPLPG